MAIHQIFAADIGEIDLSLTFTQPEAWKNTLYSFKGKRVKIVIKPIAGENIRSLDANAYYWGVVIEILRMDFGYEKEEMHDALGLMFRRDYTKEMPTIIRTSTMSSKKFWDYIERVRTWAAVEYQMVIPDPNKVEIS